MFDFLARKARSARRSVCWFLMIVAAQLVTAIATGVAVGWLISVPVILTFCMEQKNDNRTYSSSRRRTTLSIEKLSKVFDSTVPEAEKPCDPIKVLWFSSLGGIFVVGIGILGATVWERRRIEEEGGWAIGIALGGRHVSEPSRKSDRKILNVVEEIAIAYQTTPPALMVLDGEPGINVFAAGTTPENSILGITHGAIEHLKRDELQAIVAHEFSHLTNNDTRLGTRLTAILYGLNGIYLIARKLITDGCHSIRHSDEGSGGYFAVIAGVAIWPFGLAGTWCAILLSLAFSRSREFLADAEAVEKTRHPLAIATALRKILGHRQGARLINPSSPIIAPMLFAGSHHVGGLFSTHPSVASRLMAIDPDGDHQPIRKKVKRKRSGGETPQTAQVMQALLGSETPAATTDPSSQDVPIPAAVADNPQWNVLTETTGGLESLFESIPEPIFEMIRHPAAFPLAGSLLLGTEDLEVPYAETRTQLSAAFEDLPPGANFAMLAAIHENISANKPANHQVMLTFISRAKKQLADNDWYRHSWLWLLEKACRANEDVQEHDRRSVTASDVNKAACVVLSIICVCDGETGMSDYEFLRGWSASGLRDAVRIPGDELSWDSLIDALNILRYAREDVVEHLLAAISNTVAGDAVVSPEESVVVQVITKSLESQANWLTPTSV